MSTDPASPPQPPRSVTAIMVAGTVLVLLGLVAQLTANHALHEGSSGLRGILTVLSQFLMGAGGICMIAGAWRLWQWKKMALPR